MRETKGIILGGKSTLEARVMIDAKKGRGTSITIGRYCRLQSGTKIVPARNARKEGGEYLQVKVGDYVDFEEEVESHALHIASCCRIGHHAKLGNGCVLREAVVVDPYAELPDGMVVPAFSRVSGVPATITEELPECLVDVIRSRMRAWYTKVTS